MAVVYVSFTSFYGIVKAIQFNNIDYNAPNIQRR